MSTKVSRLFRVEGEMDEQQRAELQEVLASLHNREVDGEELLRALVRTLEILTGTDAYEAALRIEAKRRAERQPDPLK